MDADAFRRTLLYCALRDEAQLSVTQFEDGWFAVCPLGKAGPFATPIAALVGLLNALYTRVRDAEAC